MILIRALLLVASVLGSSRTLMGQSPLMLVSSRRVDTIPEASQVTLQSLDQGVTVSGSMRSSSTDPPAAAACITRDTLRIVVQPINLLSMYTDDLVSYSWSVIAALPRGKWTVEIAQAGAVR
jgi:hypothetical protein